MNSQNMNDLPYLISASEAMHLFGFSRPMVYQMLNNPKCGVCVIGRRKFFVRDKLLEWIEKSMLK